MAELSTPETQGRSRFPDGFRILQGKQEYITYMDHSSIRIWPSNVAAHFDCHSHSAVEIIIPHRGISEYQLEDTLYKVRPGEILIIPPGIPHELTERAKTLRYLILYEPGPMLTLRDMSNISTLLQHPIYLHDNSDLQKQAGEILMQVVTCYFKHDPMWNTLCYAHLMQLYALLGQHYLQFAGQPRKLSSVSVDPAIMNSAITYINEHYREDLCLERVAEFAGFSKCYFSRVFKLFSGASFTEYVTRKRMSAALDLLINTSRPIHEICEESGFGSMATFNRVFRQQKKCTPSQFRAIYGAMLIDEEPRMP